MRARKLLSVVMSVLLSTSLIPLTSWGQEYDEMVSLSEVQSDEIILKNDDELDSDKLQKNEEHDGGLLEPMGISEGDGLTFDVSSLSVSPKEATEGDAVEFSVAAAEGCAFRYGYLTLTHVETGRTLSVSLDSETGSELAGRLTVSSSTAPGEWRCTRINTFDREENSTVVYDLRVSSSPTAADLSALDFVVVGTQGSPDGLTFDVSSLSVSPKEATEGDAVEFSVAAAEGCAFRYGYLTLTHVETGRTLSVSLDSETGSELAGRLTVSSSTAPGEWRCTRINTFDREENSTVVYDLRVSSSPTAADLSALDFWVVPSGCSLVKYTDGCDGEAFSDQFLLAENGDVTPAFDGEPTREGYFFDGWTPEVAETVTESVTYTATWRVDDRPIHTVTFTDGCNGESFTDYIVEVRDGEAVADPVPDYFDPMREYYYFDGWDKPIASSVTEDMTYTALWTPNADYIVAVDEGPIQLSVSNRRITSVINGIQWKTTDPSIGYISSTSMTVSTFSGVMAGATFNPSKEGYATFYATDSNGARTIGSCTVFVTPSNKIDIATLDVSLDEDELVFSPNGAFAGVTVRDGDLEFAEGMEYYLDYYDGYSVGENTVVVNGCNEYRGSVELTYTIVPADIATMVIDANGQVPYSGDELVCPLYVMYDGYTLEEGIDYEVEYSDNVGVGTGKATITGKGNYTGSAEHLFEIVPASIADAAVSVADQVYDGGAKTPEPTVVVGSKTLARDTDYTVAYDKNTDAGTATVTVTGVGNYTGTASVTFNIAAADLASAEIEAIADQTFTGTAITPEPTVSLGGKALTKGTDYELSYKDNVNVGTATVTATGKGNYAGTASATFAIVPADIAKATMGEVDPQIYTGSAVAPEPTVVLGGKELAKGADYELSYKGNVDAGEAYVVATGKGNYQGSISKPFSIAPADIAGATVEQVADQAYTGEPIAPKPVATFGDAQLAEGTDYELSYADNTVVGTATVTLTGKGNFAGAKAATFAIAPADITPATIEAIADQTYTGSAFTPEPTVTLGERQLVKDVDYELSYSDNVDAGTATVTATGKGNYAGAVSATFAIVHADFAPAEIVAIDPKTYTGSAIIPEPAVSLGGKELVKGTDYELTYKDNVNAGTATVTATGKGNYAGAASATFAIVPADIAKAAVAATADQTYTGKAIEPKPAVKLGSTTLKEGTDYTLSYKANVNVGTATVTVTGKGNYAGTASATFRIVAPAKKFPDVPAGKWYEKVVYRAVALGLMGGYSDGRFGPDDPVTRGQVAVMLWNMAGRPKAGAGAKDFPDAKAGAYYYNAVRWASSAGVVNGFGDGTFRPGDKVTREQFAVMLANYAGKVAGRKVSGSAADYAAMRDAAKVSGYAAKSLGWCFANKILSGTSDGRINPQGNASRAEAAKMLVFFYDLLG